MFYEFFLVFVFSATVCFCGTCREAKLCCPGRDSSCVVQKAQINAIIEDLNDKPCYCDHACLKLGDCCLDFKATCGVIDCVVTPWGEWSECDTDCGTGMTTKHRKIQTQPKNGGKHCPSLVQKRSCLGSRCPHYLKNAIKETAMLLPIGLSQKRKVNETTDIRKNLKFMYQKHDPVELPKREYCVQFEVIKASKACRRESNFTSLRDGERICVKCEPAAMKETESDGPRCAGHGVDARPTRWQSLSATHCRGKWIRLSYERVYLNSIDENASSCDLCPSGPDYIFV